MKRLLLILAFIIGTPSFAQSLEPSDLPPIQLNQNNVRGGVTGVLAPVNGGSGSSSVLTNGQLNIGHTGNAPTAANLTAGTGVAVANGAGSITVSLSTPVAVANGGTGTALFTSGQATFASSGSIAVADATITSSSIVVVTNVASAPVDEQFSVTVASGTGFTVHSSNSSSVAVVNYVRLK